ncbi:hypothetical protein GUJ93_ZPchr0008g12092 [Zizania palustris]|uniref:Uncharacterized protein n=1 Tax=Zizania palustris TaxID=103762 RepID=A0A8J5RHF5_ZIZPA|nr:hypothetical protein GUJ93_ZPchr0008g12092 [Zizania palustris]
MTGTFEDFCQAVCCKGCFLSNVGGVTQLAVTHLAANFKRRLYRADWDWDVPKLSRTQAVKEVQALAALEAQLI